MFRKVQITFLMLFSFIIIMVGGYNCSQKIYTDNVDNTEGFNRPIEENPYGSGQPEEEEVDEESLLPDKPLDNYCNREQYEDLRKEFGSSAFARFNAGSLSDYRFGVRSNFDLNCKRMYLNMTKRRSRFSGSLTISYEDGNGIRWRTYKTGVNESENRYNRWNRRDRSNSGRLKSEFYAIFENPSGAIILALDDLRIRNIQDGGSEIVGSGELWYKMFRAYAGRKDVCYRTGTYISKAKITGRRPSVRCWLLNQGPYSCKPQGVHSGDFNLLHENYDCYDKLGTFGNLNVREAFNVGKTEYPY